MRFLLLFLLVSEVGFASSLQDYKTDGANTGRARLKETIQAVHNASKENLLGEAEALRRIDPEKLKQQSQEATLVDTEVSSYLTSEEVRKNARENKGFDENEQFFHRSEVILSDAEQIDLEAEEKNDEPYLKTCLTSGDPFQIDVVSELVVEVQHNPEIKKQVKACAGHSKTQKYYKKSQAKRALNDLKSRLARDPEIDRYDAGINGGGALSKYTLWSHWTHLHDSESCDRHKKRELIVQKESWKETGERWVVADERAEKLSNSPNCTLIAKNCLDTAPNKEINGKTVSRLCWLKKFSFLCKYPKRNDCDRLRAFNCELLSKACVEGTNEFCGLWKKTFRCYGKVIRTSSLSSEDMLQEEDTVEYEPNQSFPDVVTKLAVFDAIKSEIEESGTSNPVNLELFKGRVRICRKSIADDLTYDCCFSYGGLAKQIGLSKCTTEELELSQMRDRGLCHYVGVEAKKKLGVKVRDEHVFCCFNTHLARVLQEQGRLQIKRGWGTASVPHCRGFSMEQITQLDFSSMDLSELYEEHTPKNKKFVEEKIDSFKQRLKERIERERAANV